MSALAGFFIKLLAGLLAWVGLFMVPLMHAPSALPATQSATSSVSNQVTITLPHSSATTTTASTSTQKRKTSATSSVPLTTATTVTPAKTVAETTPPDTTQPAVPPSISPDVLNAQARAATVNIMCTIAGGGSSGPISGSGVMIDSRGIVLTNAHVAQFFLLRDYPTANNVLCVIRIGSPARAAYTAELLFLPPAWVEKNADQIKASAPSGTGENDYAFLRVTGSTNPNGSLPASFPHLPMSTKDPKQGDSMLLVAYPAGFLEGSTLLANLYQTSAYAVVGSLFVFDSADKWVDLFSIPGSPVSQSGSSGGAAVRATAGSLAGIIVTDTDATTTASRDLRAVSLAHVDQSLYADGVGGVIELLTGNVQAKAAQFNSVIAPLLTKKLIDALK